MKRLIQTSHASRRGGVLLFSLIVTSVVAVLATCLLQLSSASTRRQSSALEIKRAFYQAEAGLAEAYSGLRIGKTGNVGTAEAPAALGDGLFWVVATPLDDKRVQIESTGMVGLGRAVLSLVAERGEQSVASLGVFSNQPLSIPAGVQVTGFDSEADANPDLAPSGAAAAATQIGRVGSNDNIAVDSTKLAPTRLYADLGSGPQHTIALAKDVIHVGTKGARAAAAPLPDIEAPFEPSQPGITQQGSTPRVIAPGDHGFEHITVAAGARVVVQGPCNLVVNHLTVSRYGQLEFDTELGKVSLWVLGSADLQAGGSVSTTAAEPSRMLVQSPAASSLTFAAQGNFHAVIYAPKSQVTVGEGMRIFGAVVSNRLVLQPGARLSFDQHLDEQAAELSLPRLLSWRVVEMSAAPDSSHARDPFQLLGLDRDALPRPADAHADQPIYVSYDALGNTPAVFEGMERDFDWKKVKRVKVLRRDGKDVTQQSNVRAAPPPPPPSAVMAAFSADPPLTTAKLTKLLLDTSPLTSAELIQGINHEPALKNKELQDVLAKNCPLGSAELTAMLDRSKGLSSKEQADILKRSTPLPPDILSRVLLGVTNLNLVDRLSVLLAN